MNTVWLMDEMNDDGCGDDDDDMIKQISKCQYGGSKLTLGVER